MARALLLGHGRWPGTRVCATRSHEPQQGATGLSPRNATAPRQAWARSVAVCALLGSTLLGAGHPEWVGWLTHLGRSPSDYGKPALPEDMLLRGIQRMDARSNHEESLRLSTLLLSQHPDCNEAETIAAGRVRTLMTLERLDEAEETLDAFRSHFRSSPLLPSLLADYASLRYKQGHFDTAARSYTSLVALVSRPERGRPTLADIPLSRSEHRQFTSAQRQDEERRAQYERLGRFNLALCYERANKKEEALRAYERFALRFPTDSRASEVDFRLGMLHLDADRPELAAPYFERVCRVAEEGAVRSASIHFAGRCLEEIGRPDDAVRVLVLAIDLGSRRDPYRLAALTRLARLSRGREPLFALQLYRDVAKNTEDPVRRAIAEQNSRELQSLLAMAVAAH